MQFKCCSPPAFFFFFLIISFVKLVYEYFCVYITSTYFNNVFHMNTYLYTFMLVSWNVVYTTKTVLLVGDLMWHSYILLAWCVEVVLIAT